MQGRDSAVLRARLSAQLLSGEPARSAAEVVEHLLAVQAQDLRGARLAVRARSEGLHVSNVDAALDDGSLLVAWLNRGTLHLVRREDYWWLHALTTPPLRRGNARRLEQEGVTEPAAERGVRAVTDALAAEGPLTRAELRDRIDAAGVRTAGQALVHILARATLRGLAVRGPVRRNEQAYVLVRDWLGAPPKLDRASALAELARRYLRAHGPACERDLAKWAGLPLRDARGGLAAIARDLVEAEGGLVDLRRRRPVSPLPPPRLLGAYEPMLLGWVNRDAVLGDTAAQRLVTDNGLFRPFAMVRGRAVGTWGFSSGQVTLTPFGPLGPRTAKALAEDARAVRAFLQPRPARATPPVA